MVEINNKKKEEKKKKINKKEESREFFVRRIRIQYSEKEDEVKWKRTSAILIS